MFGRPLGLIEMRRILRAERLVSVYRSMIGAESWLAWQQEHPQDFEFLSLALRLYEARRDKKR